LASGDALVDLRNDYAPTLAEAAGFVYRGVGRDSKVRMEAGVPASPHTSVSETV
jgi:hypothetical protein